MIGISNGHRLIALLVLITVAAGLKCSQTTGEKTPFTLGLNGDNSLSSLKLSGHGSMDRVFNPQVLNYTDTVKGSVNTITVTPEANYRMARITINGAECQSGAASEPVPVAIGNNNPIIIIVTAEDGAVLQYTVTVVRTNGGHNEQKENTKLSQLSIQPYYTG